jgi:Co/Zn/Cd efflux system component
VKKSFYIPLVPYLICVFFAAIAIAFAMDPWDRNSSVTFTYAFERLGAVVALFAVAAIIAVPWRMLERVFRAHSNAQPMVGLVAFAIAAFLAFKGNTTTAYTAAQHTYDACEFKVTFPAQPEFKLLSIVRSEKTIRYDQASYAGADEYLRAECVPIIISKETAIQTLQAQADGDGFYGVGFDLTSGDYIEMRGYKDVSGVKVTYIVRMYYEPHSALTLMGAADSRKYPTEGIRQFFRSTRVAE